MRFTIGAAVLALLVSGTAQARIQGDRSPVAPLDWKEPSAPAVSAPAPSTEQARPTTATKATVSGPLRAMKDTRVPGASSLRSAAN